MVSRRACRERGAVVGHRNISRGRIERIVSRERLQHQRAILDGAGQWPAMVERIGQRKNAAPADPPIGRLQPDQPAICGRAADRAAGVGPHPGGAQMRADRRRGAARRAGRVVRRVPRVARRLKRQREIGAADREFVRLLLAEQDHAGVAQPHPALGVLIRYVVEIDA